MGAWSAPAFAQKTLAEAQRAGLRRGRPDADVEGFDAAAKAAILASLTLAPSADVYREITEVTASSDAHRHQVGCGGRAARRVQLLPAGETTAPSARSRCACTPAVVGGPSPRRRIGRPRVDDAVFVVDVRRRTDASTARGRRLRRCGECCCPRRPGHRGRNRAVGARPGGVELRRAPGGKVLTAPPVAAVEDVAGVPRVRRQRRVLPPCGRFADGAPERQLVMVTHQALDAA